MVRTEHYMTREDGVVLVRTYSDSGFMIERDGVLYDEAIDPEQMNRVYTESDVKSTISGLSAEDALFIILGGEI